MIEPLTRHNFSFKTKTWKFLLQCANFRYRPILHGKLIILFYQEMGFNRIRGWYTLPHSDEEPYQKIPDFVDLLVIDVSKQLLLLLKIHSFCDSSCGTHQVYLAALIPLLSSNPFNKCFFIALVFNPEQLVNAPLWTGWCFVVSALWINQLFPFCFVLWCKEWAAIIELLHSCFQLVKFLTSFRRWNKCGSTFQVSLRVFSITILRLFRKLDELNLCTSYDVHT